ncbi:MAG: LytR/AlgR family response regulator transcription factor [Sphingobacterium sp.]
MIRCIIIDDEQHAIEVTRSFCHKIPYLEIIGAFTVPADAAAFIDLSSTSIDLVFLDIEMPRFSGIDFLKAYSFPNVIMVTAYADFALDSYQYGVVDYLMKPFSFDRFSVAVAKVYDKHQKTEAVFEDSVEQSDVLYLKTERNKYIKLDYADIKYIEGAANFTVIHTNTLKNIVISSRRLKDLEQQLPRNRFQRIHKSHLINMDHFESLDGNQIKLKATGEKLVVGASYRRYFIDFINRR